MKKSKIITFIACFFVVFIVAFLGSIFTSSNVNSQWYESIKPSITPPNWVFPIAWTILFILIAFSLFYAYSKSRKKLSVSLIFSINFALNILWSYLYFGIRNTSAAFIDLILLWLSILSLIIYGWKIDRRSSLLLIPYLLWVSFAGVLNYLSIS